MMMVHGRVGEAYTSLALEHAWKVFNYLLLKNLDQEGRPMTPFKLFHGYKPKVGHFWVLFCPTIAKKYKAMHDDHMINIPMTPQWGIRGIHVGFPSMQARYLVFIPATHQLLTSHDVNVDKQFITTITYMAKPYHDALAMCTLGQFHDPYWEQEQMGNIAMLEEERGTNNESNENGLFQLLLGPDINKGKQNKK